VKITVLVAASADPAAPVPPEAVPPVRVASLAGKSGNPDMSHVVGAWQQFPLASAKSSAWHVSVAHKGVPPASTLPPWQLRPIFFPSAHACPGSAVLQQDGDAPLKSLSSVHTAPTHDGPLIPSPVSRTLPPKQPQFVSEQTVLSWCAAAAHVIGAMQQRLVSSPKSSEMHASPSHVQ